MKSHNEKCKNILWYLTGSRDLLIKVFFLIFLFWRQTINIPKETKKLISLLFCWYFSQMLVCKLFTYFVAFDFLVTG